MAQDPAQRRAAGRKLAKCIFSDVGVTAHSNLDDLLAAVGSIDDTMDLLPGALDPARTVKQNFIDNLPEPFKSNSTALEKAQGLVFWALQEVD